MSSSMTATSISTLSQSSFTGTASSLSDETTSKEHSLFRSLVKYSTTVLASVLVRALSLPRNKN